MATYCVLTRTDSNWGVSQDRFKTRSEADERLKELLAAGQQPRLVRWQNNIATEIQPVPLGDEESTSTIATSIVPADVDVNGSLVESVRDQFRREDCWCWETLIEEVAVAQNISLDADRLTYAGGTLRTGPYVFTRNNKKWRSLCERIVSDRDEITRLILDIEQALRSEKSAGVADSWRRIVTARIDNDEGPHAELAHQLLNWNGDVYRGRSDASAIVDTETSILYGLWRLDSLGKPLQPFPLYVGEGRGTMRHRLESSHCNWWGDGKPIGLTVIPVPPDRRLDIEKDVIRLLLPFCNIKGRKFDEHWGFARP